MLWYTDTAGKGRRKTLTADPGKTTTWATLFPYSASGPGAGFSATMPPGTTTGTFLAGPATAIGDLWGLTYNTTIGGLIAYIVRDDTTAVTDTGWHDDSRGIG